MPVAMKILIIEDDPMLQRLYGRILAQAGHTVVNGTDGSQALDIALAENPDAVIMDVMMPVMNGIDALRLLKTNEATKAAPVIMLSANDDPILMQQALQLGASRFLVKSNVEPAQVIAFVDETVAQANAKKLAEQ